MGIYLDGSVLRRMLDDGPRGVVVRQWVLSRRGELYTSVVTGSELRTIIAEVPFSKRLAVMDAFWSTTHIPLSDEIAEKAAEVVQVLPAKVALHLGTARSEPGITSIVTFDPMLARTAIIYGLAIVAPGEPPGWYV